MKPLHFLDDVSIIIYSEKHKNCFAFKIRDLKKFGYRDHVIFETKDRELLADFMIEYAES